MDLQLKGKKAFISGSTQGIGYAIAQQLAQEGASVVINGRTKEKTQKITNQLKKQYPNAQISGIAADFSNKEEVYSLLDQLENIDILINNLGIFDLVEFENITDEQWYHYFEINVMSAVRLSRKLLAKMKQKNWGRMLFISSESGINIPENMIHYGMSKAALSAVANGLSKLTKGTEITINTIIGGPTYSDGVAEAVQHIAASQHIEIEEMKKIILQQSNPHILLQRFITPKEIANLVTYLASPLAIATNGASLRADSGVLKTV